MTNILLLPNEILSLIFEYLPQADVLVSRLVSLEWKNKVDMLVSYRIRLRDSDSLDGNEPHAKLHGYDSRKQEELQKLLALRVKACDVVYLKQPFLGTFNNPLLVKEIQLTNASKDNVTKLLSSCTDLEKLVIFTTFNGDRLFDLREDYTPLLKKLKKLTEIEVGIHVFNSKNDDAPSSVFQTIFANPKLYFPCLRRVFIHYPMGIMEWITYFRFIALHQKTLRSLKLRCFQCSSPYHYIPESAITNLKRINLQTLEIICGCTCGDPSTLHECFNELVSSQKSLQCLSLDFHNCPIHIIQKVIRNCQDTLQYLKLSKVEYSGDDEFLGPVLEKCVNLRELKLHCIPRVIVYVMLDTQSNHSKGAETWGWCFPLFLNKVSLEGCYIPSDELSKIHRCKSLRYLELLDIGSNSSYGFGLTVDGFLNIVENLSNLELFTFRSASYTDAGSIQSENQKWLSIFGAGLSTGVYSESKTNNHQLFSTAESGSRKRPLNRVRGIYEEGHDNETEENVDLSQLFSFHFDGENGSCRYAFLVRLKDLNSPQDVSNVNPKRSRMFLDVKN